MSRLSPPDAPAPAPRHARQRPPARRRWQPPGRDVRRELAQNRRLAGRDEPLPTGHPDGDELRPTLLRRASRALGVAGGGIALLSALAIGLFPTQTFLDQRADTREAQERLDVLRAQNESFEDRIDRLQTDAEIERVAREQYNLVYPGEEAYAVLPAPLPPLSLPTIWPFGPMLDPVVSPAEVEDQLATP